jgi:hypothetical protein
MLNTMNDTNTGEIKVTKEDILEAKEDLEDQEEDIVDQYLNHLASFSKKEAEEKSLNETDLKKLRGKLLPKMFPDKEVTLIDIRKAVRPPYHKK